MQDGGRHSVTDNPSAVDKSGSDKMIELGRVSGVYGVKGWVRIYSYTSPRDNILKYKRWYLKRRGEWQVCKLVGGRKHGKGVVAHIEGCNDRDLAAELMGSDIAISREQLPKTEPGEYYWSDLQGVRVETVDGVELGKIAGLFETGSNDVIVVNGDRERLIPFLLDDVVKSVDLDAGLMVVDWDPDF